VSRDYLKRNAATVEGMTRAYAEGVAAMHRDKPTSLRAIARFARIADPRLIEEIYQDSIVYLEKVPRLTPEATTPILESMGKKDVAMETFADNSIVDRLAREKFIEKLYQK
jgi:hypothetical protein